LATHSRRTRGAHSRPRHAHWPAVGDTVAVRRLDRARRARPHDRDRQDARLP